MRQPIYIASSPAPISNNFARGSYISALIEGKDFLFLGYSLADWNVRVILRKLLRKISPGSVRFWAIVRGRSDIEEEMWKSHALNIYSMDLDEFGAELQKYL